MSWEVSAPARLMLCGFYDVSTQTIRHSWWLRYHYEGVWHEMDLFTPDYNLAFSLANRWLAIRTRDIQWKIVTSNAP